jgi:hypothetical protein
MRINHSLYETIDLTKSNLLEAVRYQYIFSTFLKEWREKDSIIEKYPIFIDFIWATRTAYIITLYRVADKNKSAKTLQKLLNSVKSQNLEMDEKSHKEFIEKCNSYLNEVNKMEEECNAVRCKLFAHSEELKIKNQLNLQRTKEILKRFIEIFNETVESIGENGITERESEVLQQLEKDIDLLFRQLK